MENADPDPGGQKSPKVSKKVLKTWKEKKFNNLDLYLKISIIKINNKTKFLNFKFIFCLTNFFIYVECGIGYESAIWETSWIRIRLKADADIGSALQPMRNHVTAAGHLLPLGIEDFCLSMGRGKGWPGDGCWLGGGIMFLQANDHERIISQQKENYANWNVLGIIAVGNIFNACLQTLFQLLKRLLLFGFEFCMDIHRFVI